MTMVDINTQLRDPSCQTPATAAAQAPGTGEIKSQLEQAWYGLTEAASAQAEIYGLKLGRLATLAAFGLFGLVALFALGIYGFVLLDDAFLIALANTSMPAWFSPLVRGALYFGVPMVLLALGWHTMVGYGTAEKE